MRLLSDQGQRGELQTSVKRFVSASLAVIGNNTQIITQQILYIKNTKPAQKSGVHADIRLFEALPLGTHTYIISDNKNYASPKILYSFPPRLSLRVAKNKGFLAALRRLSLGSYIYGRIFDVDTEAKPPYLAFVYLVVSLPRNFASFIWLIVRGFCQTLFRLYIGRLQLCSQVLVDQPSLKLRSH